MCNDKRKYKVSEKTIRRLADRKTIHKSKRAYDTLLFNAILFLLTVGIVLISTFPKKGL